MKIALLDLNHISRGVHTNTVPLGLGLISRYLRLTIKTGLEIKIFKDAQKASTLLPGWGPDIVGISQYCWNSRLNLYTAQMIKESNPGSLVVAGGPNLDSSLSRRLDYFKSHPFVDICVSYDGEIPFAEVVKRRLNGENKDEIINNPVAGSYSFEPKTGQLRESEASAPRVASLDIFGPMYADGVFDELLDDGFHPFMQTHRGCPFECTYCHSGNRYNSKILFLSEDIFEKDMEYLGKRFAGKHNVTLYIANTNFSLFEQDFPIARIIRAIQKKYDWPRIINVNCGKDPQKLLDLLSIVKCEAAIALQTLTPKVLENIKRKNIPLSDFVSFMRQASIKTGEMSSTDLILCLPEETKDSFLATLRSVLNSGIENIYIFTLMNLKGTPISSDESRERYKYDIRHRVVPRQFSIMNDKLILDTEEVIVGTNTMSFEDYLELRGISFVVTVFFSSAELMPLKRLLLEYGVDMYNWVLAIHEKLHSFPELKSHYINFIQETKNELFPTREALEEFYSNEENFNALSSGRLGDNVLRKYKCILLSQDYKAYLKVAVSEAYELLKKKMPEEKARNLTEDMLLYLSTRNLKDFLKKGESDLDMDLRLKYDIPAWAANPVVSSKLEDTSGEYLYRVSFSEEAKTRIKDFSVMNRDSDLSLQILYRDGTIRDFWPSWGLKNKSNS